MSKKELDELKKFAQMVLNLKLGFAPSLKDIILLESGDNGDVVTYVMFRIFGNLQCEYQAYFNVKEYQYDLCINTSSNLMWL